MNKHTLSKYFVTVAIGLILLATIYIIKQSTENEGSFSTHRHLATALISLSGKTIFISGLLFYLLPKLSKKRKFSLFIFEVIAWLAVCFVSEQYMQAVLNNTKTIALLPTDVISHFRFFSWINLVIYILLLMVIFAWHFTLEWIRNERYKRELIENQFTTELNYLKNQVNPHFLFNTLNNLFSIAQRNHDIETAGGITKLAGLMRYMLYESSVSKISLEKELLHIHNFIELNKLRYSEDEIVIEVIVEGDISQATLPPMLLLPFVENAFKHGVDIEKLSKIHIAVKAVGGIIQFTCINTILTNNFIIHEDHSGIGLENVKRRLKLLYPNKHRLEISDTGSTFIVQLQLENA